MFTEDDKLDYKNKFKEEFPCRYATDSQIQKLTEVLGHISNEPGSKAKEPGELWGPTWAAINNSDLKSYYIDFSKPFSELLEFYNISPEGEVYLYIMQTSSVKVLDYDPSKKYPGKEFIFTTDSQGLKNSFDYIWGPEYEFVLICDQTGQWCIGVHMDLIATCWKSA